MELWVNVPLPSQEHRDGIDEWLGDSQVEVSVRGEVARDDGVGSRYGTGFVGSAGFKQHDRLPEGECPVAVAQEDGDRVRALINHGQVDLAVAGEVARDDRIRAAPGGSAIVELWNVPSPLPRRMETSSRLESVTARSVRPSLLKSAATMDVAPLPGGKATVKGCWNVPSPLPGRMVTLSEPWLTTATPRLPLLVKSPVARAAALLPTTLPGGFSNVPSPLPRSTEMSDEPKFPVARSWRPSPLKSPATISIGADPAATPAALNTPLPVVGLWMAG